MSTCAGTVLMIRPAAFRYNEETAVNNYFQQPSRISTEELQTLARQEFDGMVQQLQRAGVEVLVIEDSPQPVKPDAVFPNNWLSTTTDGRVHLYPLFAPNRRTERRSGIVTLLQRLFNVERVNDWSFLEENGLFLEGTGSIVFDHSGKTAYAALSPRTSREALMLLAGAHSYAPVSFDAQDAQGRPIYHTNVLLSIGDGFAIGCSAAVVNEEERTLVQSRLAESGHEWIDLDFAELEAFGANLLQLQNRKGERIIALSQTAFDALRPATKSKLEQYGTLLPIAVPTIERVNGGSVRCMLCEIFLKPKAAPAGASPLSQ
ncbi:MAG: amidinotransferase [Chitinophagaceae bacterium]|nr:MAG: amidinotransferase [Chitinophagaceae bacterium]